MIGAVIIILSSIVIVGFLVNNYLLNKKDLPPKIDQNQFLISENIENKRNSNNLLPLFINLGQIKTDIPNQLDQVKDQYIKKIFENYTNVSTKIFKNIKQLENSFNKTNKKVTIPNVIEFFRSNNLDKKYGINLNIDFVKQFTNNIPKSRKSYKKRYFFGMYINDIVNGTNYCDKNKECKITIDGMLKQSQDKLKIIQYLQKQTKKELDKKNVQIKENFGCKPEGGGISDGVSYGNWCGPTSGIINRVNNNVVPCDDVDNCCRSHDIDYANCSGDGNICTKYGWISATGLCIWDPCIEKADLNLCMCLLGVEDKYDDESAYKESAITLFCFRPVKLLLIALVLGILVIFTSLTLASAALIFAVAVIIVLMLYLIIGGIADLFFDDDDKISEESKYDFYTDADGNIRSIDPIIDLEINSSGALVSTDTKNQERCKSIPCDFKINNKKVFANDPCCIEKISKETVNSLYNNLKRINEIFGQDVNTTLDVSIKNLCERYDCNISFDTQEQPNTCDNINCNNIPINDPQRMNQYLYCCNLPIEQQDKCYNYCDKNELVNICENGDITRTRNDYQCCNVRCNENTNTWYKECGTDNSMFNQKIPSSFGLRWNKEFMSFENTNIPCENTKPCYDRNGNSCNTGTQQNHGGGSGGGDGFQCLGNRCCTPLGCFER